jgi:hypothetical protein
MLMDTHCPYLYTALEILAGSMLEISALANHHGNYTICVMAYSQSLRK